MAQLAKISGRQVFQDRMFWLNLVVVLLATCWLPLVSMEVTGADGTVTSHQVPVYRCYQALFMDPSAIAVAAVLVHLTVCVVISFFCHRIILRARHEA
jgi:hypothetical protein